MPCVRFALEKTTLLCAGEPGKLHDPSKIEEKKRERERKRRGVRELVKL